MTRIQAISVASWFIIFGLMSFMLAPLSAFAAEGQLVEENVHFPSLEGNLVEDPADRSVLVYLPPSYDDSPTQRYPVVYLLHGGLATNRVWLGESYLSLNIKTMMDRLTTDGEVREMILVMPEANTVFETNFYVNTPVLGNYEEYIVHELVQHIDANYRTLAQQQSRGIVGHSSGGYGAVYLGMNHPEVYAAVYGHEFPIDFEQMFQAGNPQATEIFTTGDWDAFQKANAFTKFEFLQPASFSPNPDKPPFYCDWPWVEDGNELKRDEAVWQRWLAFDPSTVVNSLARNLSQLRGFKFDAGSESVFDNVPPMQAFSNTLTDLGISHEFEVFDGGHTDRARARMESAILPFFSEVLAFDLEPTAVEKATWGQIKAEVSNSSSLYEQK